MLIYYFDLVGVFAFAFLGARVGVKSKYNVLGVLICAFLTALGGGTIRELLLTHTPFYFYAQEYLLVVIAAALASMALDAHFQRLRHTLIWIDAIGMTTFAYIGARAADAAHFGLFGVVFFALLTACGGGILCDLAARAAPRIFRQGRFALPPLLLALGYAAFSVHEKRPIALAALLLSTFLLQLAVAYVPPRQYRKLLARVVRWRRQLTQNIYRIAVVRTPRT